MANTYDYIIEELTVDQNGIVTGASFSIVCDDGEDTFTHSYRTGFANNPFTPQPVADISEAKVEQWIKRDAGAENQFEASADAELEAHKLRKAVQVAPVAVPWGKRRKPDHR